MKLIYGVNDKPQLKQNIVFALQQIIAIMAATLLVPILVSGAGLTCDPAAALFGAGAGTIIYLLFTKRKSPVFLGSSFTFLTALCTAAGSGFGYWGLIIGVAFAGLVYVAIAMIIKFVGSKWIQKLLPNVIIGPVLAIIGLSLASTATGWMSSNGVNGAYSLWYILCGLVTFIAIVLASVKGSKGIKLIPFIVGIGAGFLFALILTGIGYLGNSEFLVGMRIVDFSPMIENFKNFGFASFLSLPDFTFVEAIKEGWKLDGAAIGNLAVLFVPIAVVELAQHISDHKNLSSIIEGDLLTDPGLDNTLLGDGVGSMVGAFFGGCANTTYGESISCVALSQNGATWTILFSAIGCMLIACVSPFVALINMLPKCVMGGACIAMYGFISVSGLQMLKNVDLQDSRNLYPVAAILVIGIGGLTLNFGTNPLNGNPLIQITALALAMIVGIITNIITHSGKDKEVVNEEVKEEVAVAEETDAPVEE